MWRRLRLPLTCALWGAVCGCAVMDDPPRTYETVAVDPQRNSEEAVRKTSKAVTHIRSAHWDKAELLLGEALVADVTYGPAHNNLGWVYFQQGRYYLAAWEFEYAMRLMPDLAEPVHNLGLVYETVGRHAEALEQYDLALELDPGRGEYISSLARVRIMQGERSPETALLLREVVLRDERAEFRQWAEELLATTHRDLPEGFDSPVGPAVPSLPTPAPPPLLIPDNPPTLPLDVPEITPPSDDAPRERLIEPVHYRAEGEYGHRVRPSHHEPRTSHVNLHEDL